MADRKQEQQRKGRARVAKRRAAGTGWDNARVAPDRSRQANEMPKMQGNHDEGAISKGIFTLCELLVGPVHHVPCTV